MHTPPCDAPPEWQWPRALPAGWVALALAEVLALSMRFDTAALAGDRRAWAVLLSQSRLPSLGVRLGIAVAAATLLFAGTARSPAAPRASSPSDPSDLALGPRPPGGDGRLHLADGPGF